MSTLSAQSDELRTLADKLRSVRFDHRANYIENVETLYRAMGAMREAADTIEGLRGMLQESYGQVPEQGEREGEGESYSRWHQLFGAPERAARTMAGKCDDCCECVIADYCEHGSNEGCLLSYAGDYNALLEWLKGGVE